MPSAHRVAAVRMSQTTQSRVGASFKFLQGRLSRGALAAVGVEEAGLCGATGPSPAPDFPQATHPTWEGGSLASPWQLLGDGHTTVQVWGLTQPTFGCLVALPGVVPETQP